MRSASKLLYASGLRSTEIDCIGRTRKSRQLLEDRSSFMKVDETASKGWEWGVCKSNLWGEGCGRVVLWVPAVPRLRTGAAVEKAGRGEVYGG